MGVSSPLGGLGHLLPLDYESSWDQFELLFVWREGKGWQENLRCRCSWGGGGSLSLSAQGAALSAVVRRQSDISPGLWRASVEEKVFR